MKTKTFAFFGSVTLFAALATRAQTSAPTTQGQITTFDAPGAGPIGTMPQSINPAGTITGYYWDANGANHGFLRTSDGTITKFDAPGAATTTTNSGTQAESINPAGEITGTFEDVSHMYYGFLRAKDGTITAFSVPSTETLPFATFALSINAAGEITGYYVINPRIQVSPVAHGFLRTRDGTITTFDVPGTKLQYTIPNSINPSGEITGSYAASGAGYGFLREKDGTINTFDIPGVGPNGTRTLPQSINPSGEITGSYFGTNFRVLHGFVRAKDGTITTFDAPGVGPNGSETLPQSINPAGEITGYFFLAPEGSAFPVIHGFLRATDGTITTFDAPGAVLNTRALSINPAGAITGWYTDASGVNHGFLRQP
jgi:hypothetical protein